MQIKKEIPPYVAPQHFVALDLELFDTEKKILHLPITGKFASFSICSEGDPNTVYIIDDEKDIKEALQRCEDGIWVFHNAYFDITHLRRWAEITPRRLWDTLLIEKILYGGYYSSFSLEAVVIRYFRIRLDKSVRDTFEGGDNLTNEQIIYSAKDAFWTLKVSLEQRKLLSHKRKDAFNIWKQVDLPALWAFLDFRGFRVDVDRWKALAEENKRIVDTLEANFSFNPRSPQQVKQAFIELGWDIPSTGEDILQTWLQQEQTNAKARKLAEQILQYRKYYTRFSRYGMSFIEDFLLQENSGVYVIKPAFNVIGAETGRTSARSPSIQNLPARDTKAFREPWIARPGNKLIIADYSSQEPRVHAYLSQDEHLIAVFASGKDPYIETARILYNEEIEKSNPKRHLMKVAFLAALYGQTPQGIAKTQNISIKEATELLNKFFAAFPSSYRWVKKQKQQKRYVETILGRRIWLNPYNSKSVRNALNAPHQGSSADMLKQAIAYLYKHWTFDCPFGVVAQIHDEIILDVPEHLAQEIAEAVEYAMKYVGEKMCPGVPFIAEAHIADNWAEKG